METPNHLPLNEQRAVICGKLLAILENLQRVFADVDNRRINSTLVDRFFGSASTSPKTVFGTLLKGAQAHLAKLRKTKKSIYEAIQSDIEAVLEELGDFPTTLTLKQQAMFSLGYYHQRAAQRKAATEGAAKKKANAENSKENESALDFDGAANDDENETNE